MPTEQILALLIAERDRLNRAIHALEGSAKRHGRPTRSASSAPAAKAPARRKRKALTAAQRRAHSARMKAFWAERRKKQAR